MPDKIYSIAETKAHLSELVEQAASGESLTITRRGKPIARLSPANRTRKPIDSQRLRRVTEHMPAQPEDAATAVRRMRDDERY
jgi:prevent-host-death family protein